MSGRKEKAENRNRPDYVTSEAINSQQLATVVMVSAGVDVLVDQNDDGLPSDMAEAVELIRSLRTNERGWIEGELRVQGYSFAIRLRGACPGTTRGMES